MLADTNTLSPEFTVLGCGCTIVVADVLITAELTSNKTAMTDRNSNVIPRVDGGILITSNKL
jgi:hypothetical protein